MFLSKFQEYFKKNVFVFQGLSTAQLTFTCSNSTIETVEKGVKYRQLRRSGVFIINFEHISHLLLSLLLTLNK